MKHPRSSRHASKLPGSTAVLLLAAAFLVYEWDFARRRVATGAIADRESMAYGRGGLIVTEVEFAAGGRPIVADVRTFFVRVRKGETVPILHLETNPTDADVDFFGQRHRGSIIALALSGCLTAGEILGRRRPGRAWPLPDDRGPARIPPATIAAIDRSGIAFLPPDPAGEGILFLPPVTPPRRPDGRPDACGPGAT